MSPAGIVLARRPRARRFLAGPGVPPGVAAAALFLGLVAVWVVAPGLAPHDPALIRPGDAYQGPSSAHLLGTDPLGRDVLSRLIDGARTAVLAPLTLAAGTIAVSTTLAVLAGYLRGWVDAVISRVVDVLYSIPALMVAIVIVGVTGGGFGLSIIVLLVFGLPANVRVLRAAVMERAALPYVEAARTLGVSTPRIMLTQLVPAIGPLVITSFFLQITFAIVDLSSLSFLGLGVPPGASDWGRMMAENRATMSANFFSTAAPGLCLAAVAVSANVLGDWLYTRYEQAGRSR